MIRLFSKTMSLNNLNSNSFGGQIATLLMLIMMGILLFILVTVNIGTVSLTTTNLANAADGAALSLASQLGTKSHMYYVAMGNKTQKCVSSGILGTILAVLGAIIAIVVAPYIAPALSAAYAAGLGTFAFAATYPITTIAVAMVGGALGGAAGGAISGQGALAGAIQGAMIGAAIGGAAVMAGTMFATPTPTSFAAGTTTKGATVAASPGTTIGAAGTPVSVGQAIPSGTYIASGSAATTTAIPAGGGMAIGNVTYISTAGTITPATAGATIGSGSLMLSGSAIVGSAATMTAVGVGLVGLSAASSIYNAYVADQMTSAAMEAAAKALSGLPENERLREGVFLGVLSQTVDDSNTAVDAWDSDGNGDITEKIPYFQYWWDMRTRDLKDNFTAIKKLADEYFNGKVVRGVFIPGPAKDFIDFAETQYTSGGPLYREEYGGSDGTIVRLARALELTYIFRHAPEPGVPPPDVECEECSDDLIPRKYDEVTRVHLDLKEVVETVKKLRSDSLDKVAMDWEAWMGLFYSTSSTEDYYDSLLLLIRGETPFKGLNNWKSEIKRKRTLLPPCVFGPCAVDGPADEVCNPPCRLRAYSAHPYPGTIDSNQDDEFDPALNSIDAIITKINAFRTATKTFYDKVKQAASGQGTAQAFGGVNPITYTWTDTRGTHSIVVQTAFTVPVIAKWKTGHWYNRKYCVGIRPYNGNPWVKVTRTDPANQTAGILGKWNPFSGRVIRKSTGYFSFNAAQLSGR